MYANFILLIINYLTPTYLYCPEYSSVSRPARVALRHLYADTGFHLEDLPRAMENKYEFGQINSVAQT